MQRHVVRLPQQLFQRVAGATVAQRQLGRDVIKQHPHAQRLCQYTHLRADVAVADDAQRLAAHLVAARRDLAPGLGVDLAAAIAQLTRQRNDLAQNHLCDAARVGKGRVKDRNATDIGGV